MRYIIIKTAGSESVIHCGAGTFEKYVPLIDGQIYVITDSNVFALYNHLTEKYFKDAPVYILKAGEQSKTHFNLFAILEDMLERGMQRSCTVIAFGGGVVGDIAGLAASLYMRGTNLIQIPTTLLSQVDSSVGGKTAVDLGKVKNAVGTFYQPRLVIADPLFLNTLPAREIRCGLGEIVKYGALDRQIYSKLMSSDIFSYDFLEDITYYCIEHKARIVKDDEYDTCGLRKTLNLGHTTGHAFELYYGGMSHGEFVMTGAFYELFIARKLGICTGEYADNLIALIKSVISVPAYENLGEAARLALHDKKNSGGLISLIVPESEGKSAEIKLNINEYAEYLYACAALLKKGEI